VAGNIQADGIPHCFHRTVRKVNQKVGRGPPGRTSPEANADAEMADMNQHHPRSAAVVKPIASQFYNQVMHRVATRAGRLDSQQGSATAALSGAFAKTDKDRTKASAKQKFCERGLPSERFHQRIHLPQCPTCCRAELVYAIDVRGLRSQTST
jgi:hypothetical protein